MKTFRVLGAVFFVLGLVFALLGILTSLFPLIENEQFRLILQSFQEISTDPLTNTLNAIVRFCLRSSYFLLFSGISLMVAGGLISSSAHKRQTAAAKEVQTLGKATSLGKGETLGTPRPAYYPGGLAPPAISLQPEDEEEPMPSGSESVFQSGPISGAIEPAFSSDESDAQRLMQQDLERTAQTQPSRESPPETPVGPDYTEYVSNSEPERTAQPQPESPEPQPQNKPRIVSTMGKRSF